MENAQGKRMILVAITGVVCSGKSFIGKIVTRLGYPVFSCDEEIGKLLKQKVVLDKIRRAFPRVVTDTGLDKKLLAEVIFDDPKSKEWLEGILYPKLFARQSSFISSLRGVQRRGNPSFPSTKEDGLPRAANNDDGGVIIAFFEVPLLYEKGLEDQYDVVITTRAPKGVLIKRANEREIDQKVFSNILRNQLSSKEKEKRADYVIDTNVSTIALEKKIKKIIGKLCIEK